jgi:hypothetical protein
MINDRLCYLTAVPFLYPPARGEKVGNSFLSGVLDRRHAGEARSGTEYVYKILPHPVNLKQEGEKARLASRARHKVRSSNHFGLQPISLV